MEELFGKKMNEEHTITLKELGKVKTVKVYNQAYVDKQEKQIEELIEENNDLMRQRDRLNNMRIELGKKLRDVESDFSSCKCFCPKDSPSYNEYLEWCKKQN